MASSAFSETILDRWHCKEPIRIWLEKATGKLQIVTGCYCVTESNFYFRRLLIDTSDPNKPDYIQILSDVLKAENATISNIIATHWHHDHIGSIEDVTKLLSDDCKVWKFPRSDAKEDYGNLKFLELKDHQEFDIDGGMVKVFHTPGHTTDHAIVFDERTKAVFSADCILG